MKKKADKQQKEMQNIEPTSRSMASTLSSILIGFSAAIITLMVLKDDFLVRFPNGEYLLSFYILTIIFFIFSIEFFMISTWDKKNYKIWTIMGAAQYNFGYGWFILGLSLTFDIVINSTFLAYFTLTLFFLFWILYYSIRRMITQEFYFLKTRLVIRGIMFIQIFIGYFAIYLFD